MPRAGNCDGKHWPFLSDMWLVDKAVDRKRSPLVKRIWHGVWRSRHFMALRIKSVLSTKNRADGGTLLTVAG